MIKISLNIQEVKNRVREAALSSGHDPDKIKIIAVTKTVPRDQVVQAIESGIDIVGESRVQETIDKFAAIDPPVQIHLIGHLQKNKVKKAIGVYHLIHSVDSIELLEEINRHAVNAQMVVKVLLQVNVSGEESKYGFSPEELNAVIEKISESTGVIVKGLMTIAPYTPTPEDVRIYFRKLKNLFDEIKQKSIPRVDMEFLSMGMSNDYLIAVEEGANLLRIGTAIFGDREY